MCQENKIRQKHRFVFTISILSLLLITTISLTLGRYHISCNDIVAVLCHGINKNIPVGQTKLTLCTQIRFPRIFLALLVGAALASAGAAFQAISQNPLVSPDFLGASQGAAFGACVALLFSLNSLQIALFAFFFSMLSVVLVLCIGRKAHGNHMLITILAGIMVSSVFSAGVSFIKLVADPTTQLQNITFWLIGSFASASPRDLMLVIFPITIGLCILYIYRWKINILTIGDDEAKTLGINVTRVRVIVIIAATVLVAASVSVTGIIGWVGLVIPHIARSFVGNDYRYLMPMSGILGASFLLVIDNISRLAASVEIPIGILTAFVGAPFFLFLILRKKRRLA